MVLKIKKIRWLTKNTAVAAMLAGLAVNAAGAKAQMSLSSAVELALKNDPRMKMAQADVMKAKSSLAEAHDAYSPAVGFDPGYGQSAGAPLGMPMIFNLTAQSLLFSVSQFYNVRGASAGVQSAQLALRAMGEEVAEDVVLTYLNLDNAERRQAAMTEEYGVVTRLITIMQERLDAGVENRIELLKAQRTAAQVRIARLSTEDQVTELSEHLTRLVGIDGSRIVPMSDSIPAFPVMQVEENEAQDSAGIQAAFQTAKSKQDIATGAARYRFLPQILLAGNFSQIDTSPSASKFLQYYPAFQGKQTLSASISFQAQFSLFDRAREDRAHEASADALHARYDAEHQRAQFLAGRSKLKHSIAVLEAKSDLAKVECDLAQAQLDAVTSQLTAGNEGLQMSPKDEQNARLQERQRYVDMLQGQMELRQAEVNLMRQTGQLDAWLNLALKMPASRPATAIRP